MLFDTQLNEEVDLLRETVREFAEKEIAPIADEIDRSNEFPEHLWRKFGDLGLLGMTIPEDYGGSGMGYLAHMVAVEEISALQEYFLTECPACLHEERIHSQVPETQNYQVQWLPCRAGGRDGPDMQFLVDERSDR